MTTPDVVPSEYAGDYTDYLKTPGNRDGCVRLVSGSVTVPSGQAATSVVGLIPFNAGAKLHLDSHSVYCGDFGAGTTTVDLGYVYNDNVTYTNDDDEWASADTAPQSGGFVAVDQGDLAFEAEADGWLAVTINTAAADAEADIDFNVLVQYG